MFSEQSKREKYHCPETGLPYYSTTGKNQVTVEQVAALQSKKNPQNKTTTATNKNPSSGFH